MQDFHKNGYLLIKKAFDSQEILSIEKEYNHLMTDALLILNEVKKFGLSLNDFYRINHDQLIVVPEISDKNSICRFEFIMAKSEYMRMSVLNKIAQLIHDVIDEPFVLFKDKCNLKNPSGGAFPPHQDIAAYRHFTPQFHITACLILDNSTIENGCLEIVENFNQYQIKKVKNAQYNFTKFGTFPIFDFYQGGPNNGDIKHEISQQFKWLPIESQQGDILLFHSYLPHRSQQNNSLSQRRNFFFTFNSLSEGDWYKKYYDLKRQQFDNPIFHVSTPTLHFSRN